MEKRGNLPVTRSTFRGSGIALFIETSNAEAHADMYINEQSAERSLLGVSRKEDNGVRRCGVSFLLYSLIS